MNQKSKKTSAPSHPASKSDSNGHSTKVEKASVVEETLEVTSVDIEELEEQEEENAAAQSSSGGGGNAAALAAASGPSEVSASFKNFRHHPDMENFYRFIYDNDLRQEALTIIDEVIAEKNLRKNIKPTKEQVLV